MNAARLTITAEAPPGDDIRDAIRAAKELALRLGCCIRLPFNGVTLFIWANSDAEAKFAEFTNALEVPRR